MATTLRQVAREAGVSIATVSVILSGRPESYREETVRKVQAAADKLGYRPNASALFMQQGRFGIIGFLNPDEQAPSAIRYGVIDGSTWALQQRDRHLLIVRFQRSQLLTGAQPAALSKRMTDGFLVNLHLQVRDEEVAAISRLGGPSVWINYKKGNNCVYPDDFGAGALMAQRLIKAGHRHVAWADCVYGDNPAPEHYSPLDRREGFVSACRSAGVQCALFLSRGWLPADQRIPWARSVLSMASRPSALATFGFETALAFTIAAQSLGLSLPKELSLITASDAPVDQLGMKLTTAIIPMREIGVRAGTILLDLIDSVESKYTCGPVAFSIEDGDSIVAPRM